MMSGVAIRGVIIITLVEVRRVTKVEFLPARFLCLVFRCVSRLRRLADCLGSRFCPYPVSRKLSLRSQVGLRTGLRWLPLAAWLCGVVDAGARARSSAASSQIADAPCGRCGIGTGGSRAVGVLVGRVTAAEPSAGGAAAAA